MQAVVVEPRIPQPWGVSRKRKNIREEYQQDEDTFIPFIAGYTSWGYPYGILEAEEEDIEADSDELPF